MPRWSGLATVLLSLFIAFHLVCLMAMASPQSAWRSTFLKAVRPYTITFGIMQNWGVFAPGVREFDLRLSSIATDRDGMMVIWEFPRVEEIPLLQRELFERFRKWGNDSVARIGTYQKICPDTCTWLASLYKNTGVVPEQISLCRWRFRIPCPELDSRHGPRWQVERITFFTFDTGKK